jgi:hypothetical protein
MNLILYAAGLLLVFGFSLPRLNAVAPVSRRGFFFRAPGSVGREGPVFAPFALA